MTKQTSLKERSNLFTKKLLMISMKKLLLLKILKGRTNNLKLKIISHLVDKSFQLLK